MNLLWAAALAAVVFAQKVLPLGTWSARAIAIVLIVAAIVVAV